MVILNFGHPLTEKQQEQIEQLAGQPAGQVIEAPVQVDPEQPLEGQVLAAVEKAGLTSREWQTLPLVIGLPGYAPVVACLLAELEGRCGHLPTFFRIKPVAGPLTAYEVAELINLQQLRAQARTRR